VDWRQYQDHPPSEKEVLSWFKEWPDANVAIVTGAVSGVDVVDIDDLNVKWPPSEHELPAEYVVRTPSGGCHYYFTHTPGVRSSAGKLAAGVDVRGDGGYVVIPPSSTAEGPYLLIHGDLVDIHEPPDWLSNELLRARTPSSSQAPGSCSEPLIPVGQRNDTLFRDACAMRRRGASEQEITAALSVANRNRCVPPLDEKELQPLIRSACSYTPNPSLERLPPGDEGPCRPPHISQGELLTRLCEELVSDAFCDERGQPHAVIPRNGHLEVVPVRPNGVFACWLAVEFRQRFRTTPGREAVHQAVDQTAAVCHLRPKRLLHNRVAWHCGKILYDLCNDRWTGIEVSDAGWRVVSLPPIFRRYPHQMPQNEPLRGGSVHTLWEVCNISETDRRLFAAAVGTSFVPDMPHHAMILHGEPGTGKSTITRCVKQLVDPSAIEHSHSRRGRRNSTRSSTTTMWRRLTT
jgi:hypothetical protein